MSAPGDEVGDVTAWMEHDRTRAIPAEARHRTVRLVAANARDRADVINLLTHLDLDAHEGKRPDSNDPENHTP